MTLSSGKENILIYWILPFLLPSWCRWRIDRVHWEAFVFRCTTYSGVVPGRSRSLPNDNWRVRGPHVTRSYVAWRVDNLSAIVVCSYRARSFHRCSSCMGSQEHCRRFPHCWDLLSTLRTKKIKNCMSIKGPIKTICDKRNYFRRLIFSNPFCRNGMGLKYFSTT